MRAAECGASLWRASAPDDRIGGRDPEHESLGQRCARHVRGAVEPSYDLASGVQPLDARPVDAFHRCVGCDAHAAEAYVPRTSILVPA